MPINSEHLASLTDADVIDQNGDKVGGVGQIYLDDATGQPAWVSVKSGLFGLRESFVPLAAAEAAGGNIKVPYTKDFIKDAPRVDAENHLDDSQQATLFSYYGVDRSQAPSEPDSDAPDTTAAFGSEETAQELYDGRTEGAPVAVEDAADGAVTTEYTTPGGSDDPSEVMVADGGSDLGSGEVAAEPQSAPSHRDAAAIGAGAAAGAATTSDGPRSDADSPAQDDLDPVSGLAEQDVHAAGGNPDWAETHQAHYQQTNPAAQADWAAEQTPEEPVSTEWSVPTTDPAVEEKTDVDRGGYSSDRPAAHSSAYEGHGGAGAVETTAGAAPPTAGAETTAGETTAGGGGLGALDPTVDEGAVYAADAEATLTGDSDAAGDVDAGQFGTVQAATGDPASDAAVSGAAAQTGTGYPADVDESAGGGAGGAALGGAVVGGAAAGFAASDTETTAYEVPGAEQGAPITGAVPGAALGEDVESPADGATLPSGTDQGADSGEPDADAGEFDPGSGDEEAFGAEGYRPDRDGSGMTDEEREELNRARGAL
ncbi:PRC-barrel domain-containing protein [Ornithinimicrobium ciconiae]|uniref:PRC-barrel domain-containing protein n=1 Tax=Ornithinimicrobium ciconiae TaxID=2594265 RepID=UPI001D1804E1|nr:PRC-barrel domain-containing protein [Ornithinimicrobium ciconiae]